MEKVEAASRVMREQVTGFGRKRGIEDAAKFQRWFAIGARVLLQLQCHFESQITTRTFCIHNSDCSSPSRVKARIELSRVAMTKTGCALSHRTLVSRSVDVQSVLAERCASRRGQPSNDIEISDSSANLDVDGADSGVVAKTNLKLILCNSLLLTFVDLPNLCFSFCSC